MIWRCTASALTIFFGDGREHGTWHVCTSAPLLAPLIRLAISVWLSGSGLFPNSMDHVNVQYVSGGFAAGEVLLFINANGRQNPLMVMRLRSRCLLPWFPAASNIVQHVTAASSLLPDSSGTTAIVGNVCPLLSVQLCRSSVRGAPNVLADNRTWRGTALSVGADS